MIDTDLSVIEKLARDIEGAIKNVPGTSSAFAERIMGGYYLEITPDRAQLARYGLMVGDVQAVIASGLGAEIVTTTVEGRERYGVSVRYPRDLRNDPETIAREVLVPLPNGASIPPSGPRAGRCARQSKRRVYANPRTSRHVDRVRLRHRTPFGAVKPDITRDLERCLCLTNDAEAGTLGGRKALGANSARTYFYFRGTRFRKFIRIQKTPDRRVDTPPR